MHRTPNSEPVATGASVHPAGLFEDEDGGATSQPRTKAPKSLPDRDAHLLVLREAMSVDLADQAGVYFGTSAGQLFYTRDEVRQWSLLADFLPPVYSVEAFGPQA